MLRIPKFSALRNITPGKNILLTFLIALVLSISGIAMFSPKIHATDPDLVYGRWPASNPASFTTAQLRTDDIGQGFPVLEVKNNFYDSCTLSCTTYHWTVWEFQSTHWVDIYESGSWNANGTVDVACYNSKIRYGYAYKVTFYYEQVSENFNPPNDQYWIIGHEHYDPVNGGDCPFYR